MATIHDFLREVENLENPNVRVTHDRDLTNIEITTKGLVIKAQWIDGENFGIIDFNGEYWMNNDATHILKPAIFENVVGNCIVLMNFDTYLD